jgi:hypothetical protein
MTRTRAVARARYHDSLPAADRQRRERRAYNPTRVHDAERKALVIDRRTDWHATERDRAPGRHGRERSGSEQHRVRRLEFRERSRERERVIGENALGGGGTTADGSEDGGRHNRKKESGKESGPIAPTELSTRSKSLLGSRAR